MKYIIPFIMFALAGVFAYASYTDANFPLVVDYVIAGLMFGIGTYLLTKKNPDK